ncbi:hypothetical protein FCM35_KLT16603 [Carex littledalei]|uniref:Amine oxidase domain-containing protein n=1 Tax=Carex littledalei TaxID=544730 RepID=A0A833VGJ6_9POAL|nr:hypothetical protein FCM35_KLT16603 [Carex littledalei]
MKHAMPSPPKIETLSTKTRPTPDNTPPSSRAPPLSSLAPNPKCTHELKLPLRASERARRRERERGTGFTWRYNVAREGWSASLIVQFRGRWSSIGGSCDGFFAICLNLNLQDERSYFHSFYGSSFELSLLRAVLTPGDPYMPLPNEEIISKVNKQVHELFPSSRGLELIWSSVVKIGQSLYREAPGTDPFRPDQTTPVKNFFLAGSYTKKLTDSKSMQSMCQMYAAVSYICLGDPESTWQGHNLIDH